MKTNDDNICLILGEIGIGKSNFINVITNLNNCEVGDKGKVGNKIQNFTSKFWEF